MKKKKPDLSEFLSDNDFENGKKTLIGHFVELRQRLIRTLIAFMVFFCISYIYSQEIFQFLLKPLADLLQDQQGRKLIYTGLTEAFLTYIKVSAFTAFFFSFPIMANQLWKFIAPGLYKNEKFVFVSLLTATPILFLIGSAFAYYFVFPTAYKFFLSFEMVDKTTLLPIQLEAKVNEYLSFVMRAIFAFGICFQLPVLLAVLAIINAVNYKGLVKYWRFWVVGIFGLSAIVTPPDVLSMIGLALPMISLYGLSVIMVNYMEKRKVWKSDKK